MKTLTDEELQTLLVKCWMTHDGMWFYQCFSEFGIEAANRLNKAAIKSLAPVEVRRVAKAYGLKSERIENLDELKEILDTTFKTVSGDFMGFEYGYTENGALHWNMNRCFAYEGMKMIGAADTYECGVLYRVLCWLDVLGVQHESVPDISGCLIDERGDCSGEVRFSFPASPLPGSSG